VRDSYNLNRLSIAAGAAALADIGWDGTERGEDPENPPRPWRRPFPGVGFTPFPSRSNFILARRTRGGSARPVYEALKRRKILVRYFDTRGSRGASASPSDGRRSRGAPGALKILR